MDACGLAGGSYSREDGPEAGDYVKTEFAQHGDVGTLVLKPVPGHTPPKYKVRLSVNHLCLWCGQVNFSGKIGGTAEVTWSMRNNHGGGYQYRLCAITEDGDISRLTEECFQKTPLDFVEDEQSIVFPGTE